jgi:hypothetical protein
MGTLTARVLVVALLFLTSSHALLAQGQNIFFVPPTYPERGPSVTADFNGDGKPDVVSGDGTVLLGNGDGTFTVGTKLSVAGQLIAVGDFNGDGKPDVLIISSTFLNVFLGNGDGTFQAAVSQNIGTGLVSVAVADLNGDGKADVLGVISGTAVLVLLGKGNGTFAPGVLYPVLSNSGNLLTTGDFNGDGKVDIAFAGNSGTSAPGSVGVLLGNGDGTFQTAIISPGVNGPGGLVAKDFNGDGKLDLAVSDGTTNETFILLGNGNGTFQPPASPLPASGVLASADLNGDGKLDLIVVGTPFATIFLGKGDGTFAFTDSYLDNQFGGAGINVLIGDFNGDGKPDLALDNSLLFGNGDGSFQGIPGVAINVNMGLGASVAGDFNGDGHPDIAIITGNNANLLFILLNDGTGKFSVAHSYTLPLSPTSLAVADLNHDGKLDLLFTTAPVNQPLNLNVMLGNGGGTFAPSTVAIQGVPGLITQAQIADFNGDHIPDLAFPGVTVYLGKGDGTFSPPANYFAGTPGDASLVTADFNKDGVVDIAVRSAGLAVLLGKGDGTFQPVTFSNTEVSSLLGAADLNRDGNVDLIVVNNSSGDYQVLLGNGDGTFDALADTGLTAESLIGIADLRGDGKLDLVVDSTCRSAACAGQPGPGLQVFLGNGDGTFGVPVLVLGDTLGLFVGPSALLADFNGDKRSDIATTVEALSGASGIATLLNLSGPPAPNFLISTSVLSPATVAPGSSVTSAVTVTAIGGFNGAVALSCNGLPSGATCGFAPASLANGFGTSTLTISTAASTPLGTYPVFIVGTSSAISDQRVVELTVATSPGATTAALDPEVLTFAQQASGTSSTAQTVILSNTGNAQLTISVSITGTNPGDFKQTNTCGASVVAGANCQISVTFAPVGMGVRSAAISVSDNATGSPQMVALRGTEQDFSMAPSGAASATVTPGQTANYTLSLTPAVGFNQSVTLTCSGAPSGSTCTVTPSMISLSGTSAVTATVGVTTMAASAGWIPLVGTDGLRGFRDRLGPAMFALLGMLLGVSLWLWRWERGLGWVKAFTLAVLVFLGMTLTSCGGGSSSGRSGGDGGGGNAGTPAGSYTIIVSGSFASGSTTLTHTTSLTLVVQ